MGSVFQPGSTIGKYRVVHALGRGRADGLYLATDEEQRPFAIRAVVADLEGQPSIAARFLPDAAALRGFSSLNVVPMFDVFVDKGFLYVVCEHVRGRTLRQAISDSQLTPIDSLVIVRQILAAAAAAHSAGIVHRALQPSAVLLVPLTGWELVKVADFGLATLRDEAILEFGTDALPDSPRTGAVAYMAPEQVRGRSVDQRTDLYAIGTMLFEMLAGRPPFADSDPQLVMQLQLNATLPAIQDVCRGASWCGPEIITLVTTALAREREGRYQTAAQMNVAVDAAFRALTGDGKR